jgi:hypothetical protein
MPISIAGSGTITGISAGGLPDDCITTAEIAANAVTTAKLGTAEASGLCKAWVNFNGTSTVAIRASYNVSSITDNGVGIYRVNFTTAMVDANYCAVGGGNGRSGSLTIDANTCVAVGNNATTYVDYQISEGATSQDSDLCFLAIFR